MGTERAIYQNEQILGLVENFGEYHLNLHTKRVYSKYPFKPQQLSTLKPTVTYDVTLVNVTYVFEQVTTGHLLWIYRSQQSRCRTCSVMYRKPFPKHPAVLSTVLALHETAFC